LNLRPPAAKDPSMGSKLDTGTEAAATGDESDRDGA
jgi:hypothetical protein